MNKTQKIIIFLSTFLCGSPIIFLALKNQQPKKKNELKNDISLKKEAEKEENKQKNKLSLKKEKKKQDIGANKNQQQSSSSFLFWIIFIILLFVVLAIILYIIYRSHQKSKEVLKPKHEKQPNINPLITSPQKKILNVPPQDKENELLAQKKLLKCCLYFDVSGLHIAFTKNPSMQIKDTINRVLNEDFNDLRNLNSTKITNKDYLNNLEDLKKTLRNLLETLANFLNYLTGQLLIDVYQETKEKKTDYGILGKIATNFMNDPNPNGMIVYSEFLTVDKLQNAEQQEITGEMLDCFNDNKPLDLFKYVMRSEKLTSIEDKFLFLRTFKICKFVENLYDECLADFLSKSSYQWQYQKFLMKIQTVRQDIARAY